MDIRTLTVRLDALEAKVDTIESRSKEALQVAHDTKHSVSQLLEIFDTIKGGVKFFISFVALLKYLAAAGIAFGIIWAAITAARTGKIPFVP